LILGPVTFSPMFLRSLLEELLISQSLMEIQVFLLPEMDK
jgi:hypothetical protein